MKILLLSLLLLGSSACAQRVPSSLLVDAGAYAAANVADGITTVYCPHCIEAGSPLLYGKHPRLGSYFGPALAIEAAQTLVAWKLSKSPRRRWRAAGRIQMWIGVTSHAIGFAHNLTLF